MTMTVVDPLAAYARPREADWQALHIYYTANTRPLISDCIAPLIDELRDAGRIRGYFFINYWLGGNHVRLRVLPNGAGDVDAVRELVVQRVDEFLAVRPALFEATDTVLLDFYERLWEIEYPGVDRTPFEDDTGRLALRPNNTHTWEDYVPEHGRYGGPDGMPVSEAHFEASSDLVVLMDQQLNVHLRTVRLGLSLQIMIVIAVAFLGGDQNAIARFFANYSKTWREDFEGTNFASDAGYQNEYDDVTTRTRARFEGIRATLAGESDAVLGGFLHTWADHCLALRAEITRLADAGRITFPPELGAEPVPVDATTALRRLLGSYIHMTNNRLTTTIGDEAYLAYVIAEALADGAATPTAGSEPQHAG